MIKENWQKVQANIATACQKRAPEMDKKVKLIAVTKNHTVAEITEVLDCGAMVVGENRVQEAMEKYELLKDRGLEWHLIGHLQTNKVKYAVKIFDMIQSVDSEKLAKAINKEAQKIGKVQDILVQVNLVKEESKTGIYLEDLPALLELIPTLPNLKLCGLMFIAPNLEDLEQVRPLFKQMYELFGKVKNMHLPNSEIKYLSMGMTHDYQIAIEEGANVVRVGTAIFGPRKY